MKVENMTSSKGNKVANKFIIDDGNKQYFQSYKSIIIKWDYSNGVEITLDENYWDYSVTTGRYRNDLLNEGIAERASDIDMAMILGFGFPSWRGGPMFISGTQN